MKKFLVFVLVCLVLCNSVLADFESVSSDSVSDSDSVDSSSESVDMEVVPDEIEVPLEEIDEIVDLLPSLADPAFEVNSSGEVPSEVTPGGNTVYVLSQPSIDDSEVVENVGIDPVNDTITDINILTSVAPVTPSDTSGLKAVLLGLLGNYDPVVVEFQYQSPQGYNNYLREVQPDYVWLCSFALFALMIFCIFRLGGALLRG
jgi:hypothetical protein